MNEINEYFKFKCYKGLSKRKLEHLQQYCERLDFELDVLIKKQFSGYFLIVADVMNWALDNNIIVNFGRGCLSGNTPVFTTGTNQCKQLQDVNVGDYVYTHTGKPQKVIDTLVYNINEELINIQTYYGDYQGITLTKDHIVYGQKRKYSSNWLNKKADTKTVRRKYSTPTELVEEIPAENLKIGDWLFVPKPKRKIQLPPKVVNMKPYALFCDFETYQNKNLIIEKVPTSQAYPFSIRDVARKTGTSRGCIQKLINGTILQPNPGQKIAHQKIIDYISTKFDSIAAWQKYCLNKRFNHQSISIDICLDENFYWILGKWIADGWFCKNNKRKWGICFSTEEINQLSIVKSWLKKHHLSYKVHSYATKNLLQLEVNNKIFYKWWASLFPYYASNPKSQNKSFPKFVESLPENLLQTTIKGFLNGDGYTDTNKIKSYILAQQLRYYLMSLGIPASLRLKNRSDSSYCINTPKNNKKQHSRWHPVKNGFFVQIKSLSIVNNIDKVYDLTVEKDHSYLTTTSVVHNSAAGSLVSYCLYITHVDPIKWDLLFERFMNPERPSFPDIDLDFSKKDRDKVLNYVKNKYGNDRVVHIGTLGTMKAKGAIRNITRVFGYEYGLGDHISKMLLPPIAGKTQNLKTSYEQVLELQKIIEDNEQAEKVFENAKKVEGLVSNRGVHSCGIVISNNSLLEKVPLFHSRNNEIATQWEMGAIEDIGLIKFDFLGLDALSKIQTTVDLIEARHGHKIDIYNLPQNADNPTVQKTFKLLQAGETLGLFQIETSQGFRDALVRIRPENINHLSDLLSVFRPGPISAGFLDTYINIKNGIEKPTYLIPELEPILGKTNSVMLYQEQIMKIATKLCGYTRGESDILRKSIAKKIPELLAKQESKFKNGWVNNGYPRAAVDQLWSDMLGFAEYCFNACLTGDTLVLDSHNQLISIDVLKHRLENNEFIELQSYYQDTVINDQLLEVIDSGIQEVYEITLSSGETIECTMNHKFLCTDKKYHTVQDIINNDLTLIEI